MVVNDVMVLVMAALHVRDDPAMVLVVRRAGRVVVGEGRRDGGGEKSRARRGDQKTVHSSFPIGSMLA